MTFTDEDVKREPLRMAPLIQAATGLPPLPREIPPPQPPPEHLRKKTRAELLSEFYDLLSEKGVCHSAIILRDSKCAIHIADCTAIV